MSAWPAWAAAALTVLVMADALLPSRTFFYRDLGTQFHPVIAEARQASGGGVDLLPFWTHASSQGRPLVANPGFAFLSPFSLLWLVLPHESAFDLFLVLHAGLAAAGMALLARGLRASPAACLLAGVALGLGPGVVSAHNLLWTLVALGWAPWVILAGLRACGEPSAARCALLALALAIQADGGMPEVVLGTLVLGGALSLTADAARGGGGWRRALRVALTWGACGIWGIAIAAAQLVPAALHARTTLRAVGFTAQGLLYNSLDPRALPGLVLPGWGGSPIDRWIPGAYPGAIWTETGTPYVLSHYCGLVACALALAGVVLVVRRGDDAMSLRARDVALGLAAVAALGVVVALGRHVGVVRWGAEALSPLPLRFTVKALFMTFLAVPLLAATGLDAALARIPPEHGRLARLLALALGLLVALDLASAHRGMMPTMPSEELAEPPLARVLRGRARELGAADGSWCLHHQRFPDGEWGPPPGSLEPGDLPMHLWQKRMLMSPTGLPHGIRYAFDRLGDLLEDVTYFEVTRDLYRLPKREWAAALADRGVLFVVSPEADLEAQTAGIATLDRVLGPDVGVPHGSGFVYRLDAHQPRFGFAGEPASDASAVLSWSEDHGGLTLHVRAGDDATLLIREALGDLATWGVTTSDGRALPLSRFDRCYASVPVPAGEWTLRLDHEPRGWKASLATSFVALAVAVLALAKNEGRERGREGSRRRDGASR